MCGEEGADLRTTLVVVCHGVSQVRSHHDIRLRHEGAVNSWPVGRDENLRVVTKSWSADGRRAR